VKRPSCAIKGERVFSALVVDWLTATKHTMKNARLAAQMVGSGCCLARMTILLDEHKYFDK
jgi:hypothetical protein